MKNLFYLLLIAACFSCEEEQQLGSTSTVNLNFHAVYDGTPLVLNQPYAYPGGKKISFREFNFFVSSVALLEEGTGDELDFLEINFADFAGNTSASNVKPAVFTDSKIPAVKYKGIRLSIGVPSDLNKSSASGYGAGHPLRKNFDTHFWNEAGSFQFMHLGGLYDLNNDGTFGNLPEDHPFAHYPAKNAVYQTITLLTPIELEAGKTFNLDILVDVLKLYAEDGVALDLADPDNLDTADPADLTVAEYLMNNFEKAISVE
jgi:hypothetical protein